jgi:hypothetical protein
MTKVEELESRPEDSFTIENNIPIPPPRAKKGRWSKILLSVKAGDSFLATEKQANVFATAARGVGWRVTTRKTRESEDRPTRVWLVEKMVEAKATVGAATQ